MRLIKSLLFIFSAFVILGGCSHGDQEATKSKNPPVAAKQEKKTSAPQDVPKDKESGQKADKLPATYEELAAKPIGPYSNMSIKVTDEDEKKVLNVFKDLPNISKKPSNAELDHFYNDLLQMVQMEYKGPEEAINQLRFQSLGDPNTTDSRYKFKNNLNVEIILDASGSMAQSVNGKVKMDAAKTAITDFVKKLPQDAKVALRVYGHKGSNAEADKQVSCNSSELMYPLSAYNDLSLQASLNQIKPTGWTPTGLALKEAKKDLENYDGKDNTNIVYLVSDGISTCDDQPIQAATELYNSSISPIVNVIGFDVDNKGQNELKEMAKATQGLYSTVTDESELSKELSKLNKVADQWEKWKKQGEVSLEGKYIQNKIDIFGYVTQEKYNSTMERSTINSVLFVFHQKKLMSDEAYSYLQNKNNQYHAWIQEEVEKFNTELRALNDKSYSEALSALEQKYQQHSQ